ncbi:hypothetical protein IWZ03DRAFT_145197 [Phyllosticta citriasiana]|uniref:DUF1793-domain-containing protein n=1 Tax=Phyllosticta citriasiana TaxID=595635 RepID=A0ABR1KT87_9PEZI
MRSLIALALAAATALAQKPSCDDGRKLGTFQPIYSPARPPSVPLAVRSPYTSAWSTTANNGTLNGGSVKFWTGEDIGWEGIVMVDGTAYEFMGNGITDLPLTDNIKYATPLTVTYDSQYSNFTFSAGPVELTASFFSPVIPQDLCRTSIPLSYLLVSWRSKTNSSHSVQLYSDVNAGWNNYQASQTVQYSLAADAASVQPNTTINRGSLFTWEYHLGQEFSFTELNEFPQWGNFTLSTKPGRVANFSFQAGDSVNIRYNFFKNRYLSNDIDSGDDQIFAFAHDFGRNSTQGSSLYTVGTIQRPSINFLTPEGLQSLQPWWSSDQCLGPSIPNAIAFHYDDYQTVQVAAAQYEQKLKDDIEAYYAGDRPSDVGANPVNRTGQPQGPQAAGPLFRDQLTGIEYQTGRDQFGVDYLFNSSTAYGYLRSTNRSSIAVPEIQEAQSYYSIVALSTRQTMGAYVLTVPPRFNCGNSSQLYSSNEPFMWQKEISSNGNMNTVDVLYPAMPFFLYSNPNMLKYSMNPLWLFQESGFYPRLYAMHDVGFRFPNATGYVDGNDRTMPVEESANMILMTYAYYKYTGDSSYLKQHYQKMFQWAQFLIRYALVPSSQLSTDDFQGTLENQTNLAIKGIVGLQAMAQVSIVSGNPQDSANFSQYSQEYYDKWEGYGIDPTGTHTLLNYQSRYSWSLLYNTYPDKLLNLGVVRQEVYDMQSTWYPQIFQIFGVPLDSRRSIAKTDWEMWTAATCSPETRRLFVNALAYWLNNTSTDKAFTDLHDTVATGGTREGSPTVIARPVVGGHFALLAMGAVGRNSQSGILPGGFPLNGTQITTIVSQTVLQKIPPTIVPTTTIETGTFTTTTSVMTSTMSSSK